MSKWLLKYKMLLPNRLNKRRVKISRTVIQTVAMKNNKLIRKIWKRKPLPLRNIREKGIRKVLATLNYSTKKVKKS